jgi:hypothetical protein
MDSMVLRDETDEARTAAGGGGSAGQDEVDVLSWTFVDSGAVTANPLTDSRFIL